MITLPGLGKHRDSSTTGSFWGSRQSIANKLTYLRLSGLSCSETALYAFYAQSGNIEVLYVDISQDARRLLVPQTTPAHDEETAPMTLQKNQIIWLKLKTVTVVGATGDEIWNLVKRRACEGFPLKEATLDRDTPVALEQEKLLLKSSKS